MFAKATRNFNRLDMNLVARSGGLIPLNEQVDANNVVTSATFANAQYFLEDRPYKENVQFLNVNPVSTGSRMHFWRLMGRSI